MTPRSRFFVAFMVTLVAGLLSTAGLLIASSSEESCPAGTAGAQVCSEDSMVPPAEWGPQAQGAGPQGTQPGVLLVPEGILGSNGNLPASTLCPALGGITGPYAGEGELQCGGAVSSWNAMEQAWHARTGSYAYATGPASMYRPLAEQVRLRNYWCGLGNCGNAAVPGTSNHGWGLAVDGSASAQSMVLTLGPTYHWNIRGGCSDAPWEAWHAKYCGGWTGGTVPAHQGPPPFNVLKLGDGGPRVRALNCRYLHLSRDKAGPGKGHYIHNGTRHYGPGMKLATHHFQNDEGLKPDGVYGRLSNAKMGKRWKNYKHHHSDPKCGAIGRG